MENEKYDSRVDTWEHISKVRSYLSACAVNIGKRGDVHDQSKLVEPEVSAFNLLVPKLKDFAYGSEEYRSCLREMKPALAHHYAANPHHPEHHSNGVEGMSLFDVIEMLMDWKAASERMASGGDISASIKINAERFRLSPQFVALLTNTAKEMGWIAA